MSGWVAAVVASMVAARNDSLRLSSVERPRVQVLYEHRVSAPPVRRCRPIQEWTAKLVGEEIAYEPTYEDIPASTTTFRVMLEFASEAEVEPYVVRNEMVMKPTKIRYESRVGSAREWLSHWEPIQLTARAKREIELAEMGLRCK